jgi:uncharacterized protein (TIGR00369 family)
MDDTDADEFNARKRAEWKRNMESAPFNKACRAAFSRWEPDGVVLDVPFDEAATSYPGVLHGGVVATAIDTAGLGAVMAGHDYRDGGRLFTASLTVNYLSSDAGQGLHATGRCIRRGRGVHYAEVDVTSTAGKLIAKGVVTVAHVSRRD